MSIGQTNSNLDSSPATRTKIPADFRGNPAEVQGAAKPDTKQTQKSTSECISEDPKRRVKFPKVITHRGQKATIYGRTARYPKYRLCYMAEGKRITRVFWTYGQALTAARNTVRELSKGNTVPAFKFATRKLADLRADLNGRKPDLNAPDVALSLEDAITEFWATKRLLGTTSMPDAIKVFPVHCRQH
jgi:hypothetical protein